jgi:hypothetical protein
MAEAPAEVAGPPEPAAALEIVAPADAATGSSVTDANASAGSGGETSAAGASAQRTSPDAPPLVCPHADILSLLKQDLDARDVVEILIEPLLLQWPRMRGEPKAVLSKTVEKFKVCSKRRLEFARDFLLQGNHETFPDRQEIYAALGRYDTDQAERKRERERANGGARP